MQSAPLVLAAVLAAPISAIAQNAPGTIPREPVVLAARPVATRASIQHSLAVPAFIPPAPKVVKTIPAMRVHAAVTHPTSNGKTLTLLRGQASTLPDIPPPPVPQPQVTHELTPEEIARNTHLRRHSLMIGATVYDHSVSTVQWQHPDTGEFYEAVCGFDLGLLAGIGEFKHDGDSYSLMLIHSDLNRATLHRFSKKVFPDLPEVMPHSVLIVKGDPLDPVGTAPITVLRDVIACEINRLLPYQADRRHYQQAAAAWEKEHPPIPRDETFWLRPHRGSRYLKPANAGGDQ